MTDQFPKLEYGFTCPVCTEWFFRPEFYEPGHRPVDWLVSRGIFEEVVRVCSVGCRDKYLA